MLKIERKQIWKLILVSMLAFLLMAVNNMQAQSGEGGETAVSSTSQSAIQGPGAGTAVASPVTVEPVRPTNPIYLHSRTFIPDLPDTNALQQLARSDKDRVHILLQLDFIPRQAAKEAYKAQGVELLAYLPDYAWIASVPGNAPESALDLPGVVWAGELAVADKLDEFIKADEWGSYHLTPDGMAAVYVAMHKDETLVDGRKLVEALDGVITGEVIGINLLLVEIPKDNIAALAANDAVQWIEQAAPPMDETNSGIRPQIGVDTVNAVPYDLDGTGIDVLVYDSGQAGDHVDFGARLIHGDADSVSEHSTHVAGTVGGDGTGTFANRGMAPAVDIISYGTQNYTAGTVLFYDRVPDIENDWAVAQNTYGADLGTASLGSNIYSNYPSQCPLYGNYGSSSMLMDQIVRGGNAVVGIGDKYVATWAAGNERGSNTPCASPNSYSSIAPPGSAKNPIHVGASNTNNNTQAWFSSWGPTDDGRIKPTVTAGGCQTSGDFGITSTDNSPLNGYTTMCGTSMATPAVAGSLALMLQHYRDVYNTSGTFWPSTAKAILIQTADDLGNPGPDYSWGFGQVNVVEAVDLISRKAFRQANIAQGEVDVYYFVVGEDADPAKVSLVWDDFEATLNANPVLINDLNLELISPSGVVWQPWVLNPAIPANNATRGADNINNQEQIEVPTPEKGTWMVRVSGATVPQGPQDYSLACENCQVLDAGVCQAEVAGFASASHKSQQILNTEGDEMVSAFSREALSVGEQWQRALEVEAVDPAQTVQALELNAAALSFDIAQESGPEAVVAFGETLRGAARDQYMEQIIAAQQEIVEKAAPRPETPAISEADEIAANEAQMALAAANRANALIDHNDPAEGVNSTPIANETPSLINAPAADLTVGAGCTYATIGAAISAASSGDHLFLEGGVTFTENILVSKDLEIIGGYNGCNSGLSTDTTIDGGGSGSAATINNSLTVTMENLQIINGNSGSEGGGIKFALGAGGGTLDLTNVDIHDNAAQWGGGIWIGPDADVSGSGINIYNNTAITSGGGVRLYGSRITLNNASGINNIYNNTAPLGGGVYGTLQDAITPALNLLNSADIYDNQALTGSGFGGGVYMNQGTISLADCSDIYSNDAIDGGGAYLINSTLTAVGSCSEIENNQATGNGGGIYALDSSTINLDDDADLYNNDAGTDGSGNGGGAYLDNSSLWSDQARIRFNVTADYGGGVYAVNGATLDMDLGSYACWETRCSELDGNTATNSFGGSVYAVGNSEVDLRQTFIEDSSASLGGGIYASGSPVYLYNSVVAENNATGSAGDGIRLISSSNLYGNNNTLVNNSGRAIDLSTSSVSMDCSIIWGHSTAINLTGQDVEYSDIQGGYVGTGNIDLNPLFINTGTDDYHLQGSSPAIDRCITGWTPDFENDDRPAVRVTDASPYDMGADEVNPTDVVGINGAACAYTSIQQAVNAASDGDTLQVASGVYLETIIINVKDLTIEGGYNSSCMTTGGGSTRVDGGFDYNSSFYVGGGDVVLRNLNVVWGYVAGVYATGGATVTLDNTDVYNNHTYNGGVYVSTSSVLTITNDSDIYDNTNTGDGGGGVIYGTFYGDGTYSDTYRNCAPNGGGFYVPGGSVYMDGADVIENQAADASGKGGGFYVTSGGLVTMDNGVIVGELSQPNTAYQGGGVYADNAAVSLVDSVSGLIRNQATDKGGGGYGSNGATLNIDSARVGFSSSYYNTASEGGGIYLTGSTTSLNVSNGGRIYYNTAANGGGGISVDAGASAVIDNGTVSNNSASWGGGVTIGNNTTGGTLIVQNGSTVDSNAASTGAGIYTWGLASTVINDSSVSNNVASSDGGGAIVYNTSVLTLNGAIFSSNQASSGGGVALRPGFGGTPTLDMDNSTLDGNTALAGGGISNEGALTVSNSDISGNSANGDGGGIYNASTDGDCNSATAVTIQNSTFSNNMAGNRGGGIHNYSGVIEIGSSTITTNTAPANNGGGIYSYNDSLTCTRVGNSIIAGNTGYDVAALTTVHRFYSLDHNLVGTAGANVNFTLEFNQTNDQTNVVDPGLAPLADNGGSTQTHALLPNSPAIDAGDPAYPAGGYDQRGVGYDRVINGRLDIGAYETAVYTLTIAPAGTGGGLVSSIPVGINCGVDCSKAYADGTVVTLTAVADVGSTFTGWNGDITTLSNPTTLTIDVAKNVTATFTLDTHELTVALDGTGDGSVSSFPLGISCEMDCAEVYDYGTVVTLTATASAGYFAGWGGSCAGTDDCIITIGEVNNVTATFTLYSIFLPVVLNKGFEVQR